MSSAKTRTGKWIILSLIVLGLTGAVYAGIVTGTWQWLTGLIQEKTHPALLLVTFLVLPVVGFPISVFLILLGIRFGPGYGLLIMWTGMGTHLLITFILSRSYIRPWLFLLADKWAFTVPRLPENRQILVSLLFMAVPGLPYTLKNYLLALAGVPFVTYFTVSWIANGLMGTPFVVLSGASAKWAIVLPAAFLFVITLTYYIEKLASKKLQDLSETGKRNTLTENRKTTN